MRLNFRGTSPGRSSGAPRAQRGLRGLLASGSLGVGRHQKLDPSGPAASPNRSDPLAVKRRNVVDAGGRQNRRPTLPSETSKRRPRHSRSSSCSAVVAFWRNSDALLYGTNVAHSQVHSGAGFGHISPTGSLTASSRFGSSDDDPRSWREARSERALGAVEAFRLGEPLEVREGSPADLAELALDHQRAH